MHYKSDIFGSNTQAVVANQNVFSDLVDHVISDEVHTSKNMVNVDLEEGLDKDDTFVYQKKCKPQQQVETGSLVALMSSLQSCGDLSAMLRLCTEYDRCQSQLNQTVGTVPDKSNASLSATTTSSAVEMVSFDSFKRGLQTHIYQQAYFMYATHTTNAELNFTHRHAHGQQGLSDATTLKTLADSTMQTLKT